MKKPAKIDHVRECLRRAEHLIPVRPWEKKAPVLVLTAIVLISSLLAYFEYFPGLKIEHQALLSTLAVAALWLSRVAEDTTAKRCFDGNQRWQKQFGVDFLAGSNARAAAINNPNTPAAERKALITEKRWAMARLTLVSLLMPPAGLAAGCLYGLTALGNARLHERCDFTASLLGSGIPD